MSALIRWEARPDAELLVDPAGARWTYGEARDEVVRRAARLAARGERAGLVAAADADGVLGILAALRQPQPPVLLHPRSTESERSRLAERFGLTPVDAAELRDRLPGEGAARAGFEAEPELDQTAVVLTTSGSTGAPKGVRLSFRALEVAAAASAANLGWRPDDRWLLSIPAAHVGGLSIVTRCLLAGRTVALPGALKAGFRPDAFRADVDATGATLVSLVPTMLNRLLTSPGFAWPGSVRVALIGGAHAPPDLLARAWERGWPVFATYGLTEAAAQVATQRLGDPPAPSGAVGPPLPGFEVRIRAGHIQLRGKSLFSGYEPAEASTFDAEGWFDTRDCGRWDDLGRLKVFGRGPELIVSGGENVFPSEVEAELRRSPLVDAVAVVGVPDPDWGSRVAALVVLAPGADLASLDVWCARELAPYKRPRQWQVAGEVPALPSGKPDRAAIRAAFQGST